MSADPSTYRIPVADLRAFVAAVFRATGSANGEARIVADHLVDANLAGHESHGVIRVSKYVDWHAKGMVIANQHAMVVRESPCNAVIDGQFGYGQVIGREAMDLAIAKARQSGFCAMSIRNAGHLGRIGAWAEQAAHAGLASIHFVNTSGFGILVAPYGGTDRRLSANRIAAGAPGPDGAAWVKASPPVVAGGEVLLPGEIERRTRARLERDGIPLDGVTRRQIADSVRALAVALPQGFAA